MASPNREKQKEIAGAEAAKLVENEMVVGLGTGSTAEYFVRAVAKRVHDEGLMIKCICTSTATEDLARELGLNIVKLASVDKIDLAVDGADVVARDKTLIKGYGGALTREKIVEYIADKFVVIVDESKVSPSLSRHVPVEYLPFAQKMVERGLKELGAREVKQRMVKGVQYSSDNNFYIADADFGEIPDAHLLEKKINHIPGVLENGIFTKKVFKVIIGTDEGVKEL